MNINVFGKNRNNDEFPEDRGLIVIPSILGNHEKRKKEAPQFTEILPGRKFSATGSLSRSDGTTYTSTKRRIPAYDPYRKSIYEDLKEQFEQLLNSIKFPKKLSVCI